MKRPALPTALIVLNVLAVCALYVAGQVLLPGRGTQEFHDSLLRSAINERAQRPPHLPRKTDAEGKYVPPTPEDQLGNEMEWMKVAATEQAKARVVLNVTVAEMRTASRATNLFYAAFALLVVNCLFVLKYFFVHGPNAAPKAAPASETPPEPQGPPAG